MAGLATSTGVAAIVRAVVDLAAHLGIEVVAEGVEDAAVRTRRAELGCRSAQRYLVGRPTGVEPRSFAGIAVPAPRAPQVVNL